MLSSLHFTGKEIGSERLSALSEIAQVDLRYLKAHGLHHSLTICSWSLELQRACCLCQGLLTSVSLYRARDIG